LKPSVLAFNLLESIWFEYKEGARKIKIFGLHVFKCGIGIGLRRQARFYAMGDFTPEISPKKNVRRRGDEEKLRPLKVIFTNKLT
jgi:hypothetical protein